MSIYLSPGVYSKEKDISEFVGNVASSSAALVGYSAKGDVDNIKLMTNSQQFIEEYGQPDTTTGKYFHQTALAYLSKGNTLYALRVVNGALYGGCNIMTSVSSEVNAALSVGQSSSSITIASGFETDVCFQILGANPGVWDNRVGIKIENVKTGSESEPTDQYTFDIVVYWQDDDGNWSEVERWNVSRKEKLDGYGRQLYLEDKINGYSSYIVVADNSSNLADTVLPVAQSTRLEFTGGTDGSALSAADVINGWDEFANPDDVDVRMLLNGGESDATVHTKMNAVVEARADCEAILDMPYASINTVDDMVTFRTTTQNLNSNYSTLFSPWVQIYDSYNAKLMDVPPSGYIGAQTAYNDYVGKPWTAVMGFTRGLLSVEKPTKVFTQGERDTLYANQINPIQMFRGEGTVIWGQKTEQAKSSALSRRNVRRMLIVIEKSMSISLRQFVGENNTELNRFRVVSLLEQYLDRLSAEGAFQTEAGDKGFKVLCNTTNNTPAVIANNELHVDVFVKPAQTAEFIQLQTIVTGSGASFEELISRGIFN